MATPTLAEVAGDAASIASLFVPQASVGINIALMVLKAEPAALAFFQSLFGGPTPVTADNLPALAAAIAAQQAAEAEAAKIDAV